MKNNARYTLNRFMNRLHVIDSLKASIDSKLGRYDYLINGHKLQFQKLDSGYSMIVDSITTEISEKEFYEWSSCPFTLTAADFKVMYETNRKT